MFFCAVVHFHCIDPSASSADGFSGTDQHTEVTAHTVLGNKNGFARFLIKPKSLMSAVPAGQEAPAATYTAVPEKFGIDDGIPLQLRCIHHIFHAQAHQVGHFLIPPLGHIDPQALKQVVNDAVTILHDRRAGIAANCGAPPHRRGGGVGVQIHIGDALDGVDCRDAAGAALHGRPGGVAQLAQVSSFGRFIAAPVSF